MPNSKLREALEFYANGANHGSRSIRGRWEQSAIRQDGGRIARAALGAEPPMVVVHGSHEDLVESIKNAPQGQIIPVPPSEAEQCWALVKELSAQECWSVEIIHPNPEFGGPDYKIEVLALLRHPPGDGSGRYFFEGSSYLECLKKAKEELL